MYVWYYLDDNKVLLLHLKPGVWLWSFLEVNSPQPFEFYLALCLPTVILYVFWGMDWHILFITLQTRNPKFVIYIYMHTHISMDFYSLMYWMSEINILILFQLIQVNLNGTLCAAKPYPFTGPWYCISWIIINTICIMLHGKLHTALSHLVLPKQPAQHEMISYAKAW